jgi:ATP-binding cassette subfamily B protein
VLQEVNLHIKPGQTVALVGQTGAGKSTMVSLLARFYDVTQGRITVDGYDVREVTRESLAGQMGMVLQEPFLYSVSVADNIRFRHTDAPMDKVIKAARAVGAHDFIMRMEHGYDTVLHERGGNLSLGQRQLISFARAVLAAPRILILDEATANIDTFTEVLIQRALRVLLKGRTAIVIAHRLSTIQNADIIVVLEKGRIVDTGTHDQLLERSLIYSRLYSLNFQDEAAQPALAPEDAGLARARPTVA